MGVPQWRASKAWQGHLELVLLSFRGWGGGVEQRMSCVQPWAGLGHLVASKDMYNESRGPLVPSAARTAGKASMRHLHPGSHRLASQAGITA